MKQPTFGLDLHALDAPGLCHWNTRTTALVEMALARDEGKLARDGSLVIERAGALSERAADRLLVRGLNSAPQIAWTRENRPFDPRLFSQLYGRLLAFLQGRELFVQDRGLGGHENRLLRVRAISNRASHALLAHHLMRAMPDGAQSPFFPDLTIFLVPDFAPHPAADQLPGRAAALLDLDNRVGAIVGTAAVDELPLMLGRALSFFLPEEQRLPLWGTALQNRFSDDVFLLIGRPASGKTRLGLQLCADCESLEVIGDGALALSEGGLDILGNGSLSTFDDVHPHLCQTFGNLIESGDLEPEARRVRDVRLARLVWPRDALPPLRPRKVAPTPRHLFLLVRDDTGALPPIARLDLAAAAQLFALGPGAVRRPGREAQEVAIDFDDCLDARLLLRPRAVHERLFHDKLRRHGAQCWLVNTGRLPRDDGGLIEQPIETASLLAQAAIEGDLERADFRRDRFFGFEIPTGCQGMSAREIDPIGQLRTPAFYERRAEIMAEALAQRGFTFSQEGR